MFKNEIDTPRILKSTQTILNILKKTIKDNIGNKKLYKYIINNINSIKIEYINVTPYNLEIGNNNERFYIQFIGELESIKEIRINYINANFTETKILKINNDIVELHDSKIINKEDYKTHTSLSKAYKNNMLNKIKYNKIDFIKDIMEEFEVYINNNIIFGKKISGNRTESKKEEYYYCDFKYPIKFSNLENKEKNISSDFLEDFIFLYLEKFNSSKEEFDIALNNWKKEQESMTLCKRKK